MRLAQDPRVSNVMVFKRTPDEQWKRVPPRWDLEPPFDPDLEPLFQEYGDGGYRFVAVIRGKLRVRTPMPELLAEVVEGVVYVNGERVRPSLSTAEKKVAA